MIKILVFQSPEEPKFYTQGKWERNAFKKMPQANFPGLNHSSDTEGDIHPRLPEWASYAPAPRALHMDLAQG